MRRARLGWESKRNMAEREQTSVFQSEKNTFTHKSFSAAGFGPGLHLELSTETQRCRISKYSLWNCFQLAVYCSMLRSEWLSSFTLFCSLMPRHCLSTDPASLQPRTSQVQIQDVDPTADLVLAAGEGETAGGGEVVAEYWSIANFIAFKLQALVCYNLCASVAAKEEEMCAIGKRDRTSGSAVIITGFKQPTAALMHKTTVFIKVTTMLRWVQSQLTNYNSCQITD